MKAKCSLLLFSILFYNILIAQTNVCYTYDKAGNRTTRTIRLKSEEASSDSVSIAKIPITENLGEMVITLYPNPTKGQLMVQITHMPDNTMGEITLYDLSGRLVTVQNTVNENTMLDLSVQPLGIYVLRIRVGGKVSEWKVIKE